MKREEYQVAEARAFVWNHLWRADSQSFVHCPILDVVEVDHNGNIPRWLFTTRDGEVKSKSAKNRNLSAALKSLRCHFDKCEAGFHGYFSNSNADQWYAVKGYEHLKELMESHASDMVIVPHPHPDGASAKFMEIKLWRDEKHVMLEPKIKCYWLSHASAAGKVQSRRKKDDQLLPEERLVCRNNALIATAHTFALSLLAHLEARAGVKISTLQFIAHVAEMPSLFPLGSVGGGGDAENGSTFRIHFHHANHLIFDSHSLGGPAAPSSSVGGGGGGGRRRSEQCSQSLGEFSTKLSSHGFLTRQASLTSSVASASTYIKPWTFCSGVFCTYAAIATDGSGAAEPSMGLDFEDGDVLAESQRAIQRHRPSVKFEDGAALAPPSSSSSAGASRGHSADGDADSRRGSASSARRSSTPAVVDMSSSAASEEQRDKNKAEALEDGGESRIGTLVPLKRNKLLYKNLVLVRDEIRRLEEIDRQYIDEAHNTSEKLDAIYSMREAMKEIWPLPLIRWWFGHGQFYALTHASKSGVGRLPATVNPEAIVPPSVMSKIEKQKLQEERRHSVGGAALGPSLVAGRRKNSLVSLATSDGEEASDASLSDDEDAVATAADGSTASKSTARRASHSHVRRPPKLPKEVPTAMSLGLPEAIANPLSTSNPAIPFSDKSNVHLSDAIYPSRQSLLNNPEDTKWFSLHHQDVTVCDRCYLVYCRLETFRKAKFQKIRELLRQEKREKLSPDEQRRRDRDIERRIFAQKQSTYKLSQAKPRRNDHGDIEPVAQHYHRVGGGGGRGGGGAPKGVLPPLPWRLNDDEERDRYMAPASHSMAEKLMKKMPLRSMSAESGLMHSADGSDEASEAAAGGGEDIDAAWEAMMRNAQGKAAGGGGGGGSYRLPPLGGGGSGSLSTGSLTSANGPLRKPTNVTMQQSLKVAVDQYTAEHLLHPWQRDLKRLKEALHEASGLTAAQQQQFLQQPQQQPTLAQQRAPLGSLSSQPSTASAATGVSSLTSSSSAATAGGGGSSKATLTKSVSFRFQGDESTNTSSSGTAGATSPSKLGRQNSFDASASYRPGTSAHGSSRGSMGSAGTFDKDGMRSYKQASSWSSSIPEFADSGASPLRSPTPKRPAVGIADARHVEEEEDDDDDDMDIAGGGLGWNPFVLSH